MSLIVYASKKGTSKQYALLLSEITGVHVVDVESIQYANPYERVVFIAPMYGGKIHGIKQFKDSVPLNESCRLMVGVVGIHNPDDPEVTLQAKRAVLDAVPESVRDVDVKLLRGNYNHSKLTPLERLMMFAMKKKVERTKPENVSLYERELVNNLGKDVSFFDMKYLYPLIDWLEQ